MATRAAALTRRGDLETTITRRDYRADGLWQAAYAEGGGPFPLDALRDAFLKPRFALWAGRKSCPLGPLAPTLLADKDLEAAFLVHAQAIARAGLLGGAFAGALAGEIDPMLAADERIAGRLAPARNEKTWLKRRIDEPGNRLRWHFSARQERTWRMAARSAEEGRSP